MVPSLFLYGAAFSSTIVMGICVPSIAQLKFCIFKNKNSGLEIYMGALGKVAMCIVVHLEIRPKARV